MLDVILPLNWIIKPCLEFIQLLVIWLIFLLQQLIPLLIINILQHIDLINRYLMQISNLLLLISFILLYLCLDRVENWNEQLILLLNDLLVRTQSVQHVEIVILINQSLCMQAVIVLSRGQVLGEYDTVSETLFSILTSVPVILTLICHYLLYSLPVNSLQILIVQIVVQSLQCSLILLLPCTNVLLQPKSLLSDLSSKVTLIVEVFHSRILGMLL